MSIWLKNFQKEERIDLEIRDFSPAKRAHSMLNM